VKDAVERKIAGEEVSAQPEAPKAQIIDLLEALKRSVAAAESAPKNDGGESVPPSVSKGPKKAEPREEAAATEAKPAEEKKGRGKKKTG